jgi:hypothetical protein
VQPLQSVNCLNSCAHGHEWHGPFTRLVGTHGSIGFRFLPVVMVGFSLVNL